MDNVSADFTINENQPLQAEYTLGESEHFDCSFELFATGTAWGLITGNLEDQTDLWDVLSSKADTETVEQNLGAIEGEISDLSDTVDNNYSTLVNRLENDELAISNNSGEITSLSNTIQSYGDIVTYNASSFATSAQGALADTALQSGDNISELSNNVGYITNTALNGYATENFVTSQGYITGISSEDVTDALGYIPYDNTNPDGYITSEDLPTLEDLTTQVQLDAINSGATTAKINQIASNTQAISTETANRQNADNNLQSQIDAITASSDVTDIVGTYAQLQAYDTSTLAPNSIIKVLQDEHQNNETTYYRWVITGGVGAWVLIGEEGPYYTKSEADGRFVPQTRTINGKDLSNNISLTASDVNALPSSTVIPTVNNGTLDIQVNGTSVGTFTANQSGNTTANIVVPDSATWGNITGDIADQTDLQTALDDKQDKLTAGTDLEIVDGVQLPEGYTALTYIQTSGQRYIDTGVPITTDTELHLDIQCFGELGIKYVLGDYTTDNGNFYLYTGNANTFQFAYGNKYQNSNKQRDLLRHQIKFYIQNGYSYIDFDGTNYGSAQTLSTLPSTPIIIGGAVDSPRYVVRTYSTTIVRNGTVIRNYIPCKHGDLVGMYETIEGTFEQGVGTGSYIAGNELPSSTVINFTNETGYITGIDSNDVTTALGYTPVNPSSLATVATTGSYNDLTDKPYIPSGVVVDQTFDPTSTNAQSGVAINGAGFLTGITSSDVTTALGYTPYNSSNPNGYTSNVGTVTSVNNIQPVNGNVTISIPTVPTNISAFTNDSGYITSSALTGYATQNWVGEQGYITGISSTDVTTALGYTPYNSTNPNGYTSNVGTVTSVNNVQPVNGNVTLSIPSAVTESTVAGWGFTKNTGTVTSVNNVQPVNGNVTISIPDVSNFVTNSSLATTLGDYVKSSVNNTAQGTTATIGYVSGFAPAMQLTYGNYQMLCGCAEGAILSMIDTTTNIQTAISAIPAGIAIKQGQQQALLSLSNNNLLVNGSELATQTWVGQQGYLTSSSIANMQTTGNLVTSISSSSTDSQYPSAKCVYDIVGDIETLLQAV